MQGGDGERMGLLAKQPSSNDPRSALTGRERQREERDNVSVLSCVVLLDFSPSALCLAPTLTCRAAILRSVAGPEKRTVVGQSAER